MKQLNLRKHNLKDDDEESLLLNLLRAIKSIEYGYVQIIIQNSKIVQIDKTEKIRLNGQKYELKGGGA